MSFSKQITAFNEKTEKKFAKVIRIASFDIFGRIVKLTPVDTGRLRNNWQISPLRGGFFISNNLPYAKRIEDGYSEQAPAGMVKVAIAEWPNIVKLAASKV